VAQANEQVFVAKALERTPKILVSVTKRGVHNLETAIGCLSTPFVAPAPLPRKSSGSGKKSSSRQDQSISEISIDSTLELAPHIISAAEELVLNARRKQAILVSIIIMLQTYCRRFLAKTEAGCRRKSGRRVQLLLGKDEGPKELSAAIIIEGWWRVTLMGYHVRKMMRTFRNAACCVQSVARGRKTRFAYSLVLESIRRVQARFRGFATRVKTSLVVKDRLVLYRKHIFVLWETSNTPLSFRSKFWPFLEKDNFTRAALGENEIHRLWRNLKVAIPHSDKSLIDKEPTLQHGRDLGMNIDTHLKCKMVTCLVLLVRHARLAFLIHSFTFHSDSQQTFSQSARGTQFIIARFPEQLQADGPRHAAHRCGTNPSVRPLVIAMPHPTRPVGGALRSIQGVAK
jgi:hypothetical protein